MTTPTDEKTPRIAVLIPAYKAERTIERALRSLDENKEPHDVVIVDDGSPLPVEAVLPPQARLKIIRCPVNGGVTFATNIGLDYILQRNYEFVARLDADDRAAPGRLALQRAFLDAHPEIGFVGSWARFVSEKGKTVFHLHPPEDHETLVRKMYYNNCFLHPSLMIRTSLLRETGPYSEDYPSAEDYEMIRRLMKHSRAANIPSYLIDYTVSSHGITLTKRREQLRSRLKVQWAFRDWNSPHFFLGITKTFCLSFLPFSLVTLIKKTKRDYHTRW